jgi:hypothetical protein
MVNLIESSPNDAMTKPEIILLGVIILAVIVRMVLAGL